MVILILVLMLIGAGRVFNFINQEQAMDYGGKAIGVLVVLALGAFLIGFLIKPKNSGAQDQSKGPGPQF